jgi:hypothetical protein
MFVTQDTLAISLDPLSAIFDPLISTLHFMISTWKVLITWKRNDSGMCLSPKVIMIIIIMWSSYDRTWFSGPDKHEIFLISIIIIIMAMMYLIIPSFDPVYVGVCGRVFTSVCVCVCACVCACVCVCLSVCLFIYSTYLCVFVCVCLPPPPPLLF